MTTERIESLRGRHSGQTAWIIGKGPSLDRLKVNDIGEGPLIALNQSILRVQDMHLPNPIYSMQKDGWTGDRNDMVEVDSGIPLILHEIESKEWYPDHPQRLIFDNYGDFGMEWNTFSAITAIEIARLMGCKDAVFVCCDSHLSADNRTWKDTSEPQVQYLKQRRGIEWHLEQRPFSCRWFIPISNPASMMVMIATAFYMSQGFSQYIRSLFNAVQVLERAGVPSYFYPHNGDSYVDRARNTIAARFLDSDCTDLLMIDSDMEFGPEAVAQILKSPYEVTGGAYPMKNLWAEYPVSIFTDENGIPIGDLKAGLIKAKWVTAGFLRIKRSALEKMRNAYGAEAYFDQSADPAYPLRPFVPYFHTKLGIGGEDQTFCEQWREIGGEVWCEPRITFGHYGIKRWEGNYHEFLMRQPGGMNDPLNARPLGPPSTTAESTGSSGASPAEPVTLN